MSAVHVVDRARSEWPRYGDTADAKNDQADRSAANRVSPPVLGPGSWTFSHRASQVVHRHTDRIRHHEPAVAARVVSVW